MNDRYSMAAAVACIRGENEIHGKVSFIPRSSGVLVTADICGLPETKTNFFGLHIHEGGDCGGMGFPETGGHYNPQNTRHPNHEGDLPPLLSCGGKAWMAVMTNRFCISDVIGRTVVIHSDPDDFKTQPSGNTGSKIACGVIRKL